MSDELERFRNNANIACRVHGYGLSLDAITCIKIADEIDTLRAKLDELQAWKNSLIPLHDCTPYSELLRERDALLAQRDQARNSELTALEAYRKVEIERDTLRAKLQIAVAIISKWADYGYPEFAEALRQIEGSEK